MIKIVMDDGERLFWDADEYTDYECNYGLFIVKNGDRWVGIYNMDHLLFVEVDDRSECFDGFNTADVNEEAKAVMKEAQEVLKKNIDRLQRSLSGWKKENGK